MNTISVIIPTYHEAERIAACLGSIISQTIGRERMEIIVSDANSTDATIAIARPLTDRIVTMNERGIARGRNAGAREAKGEIFVFIDADTVLDRRFLEEMELQFMQHGVVGVTGIASPSDGNRFAKSIYRGTYLLVRFFHFFGLALFPGICVAYRADAFRAVGGFREDLGISEDLDLSRRISKLGKTKIAPNAKAFVSTRRLAKNGLSVVGFHILHHLRYLMTGSSAKHYPKAEEVGNWQELWKAGSSGTNTSTHEKRL